eukprot:m.823751 g.823751  ORF g.823751 m.823751 type:complete len:350 (+) comp23404_c0_seq1:2031-3080(+)
MFREIEIREVTMWGRWWRRCASLLREAAARARWCGTGVSVVHWRRSHTASVETAAERLHANQRRTRVIDGITGAPKTLGDGSESWPHCRLDVASIHGFPPHLTLPTKNETTLLGVRNGLAWFVAVQCSPCDVQVVQVPRIVSWRVVDECIVPCRDNCVQGAFVFPHVNNRLLGEVAAEVIKHLDPLHGTPPLCDGNVCRALDKVRVSLIGREPHLGQPCLYCRGLGPAVCVDFVSAKVNHVGREQTRGQRRGTGFAACHFPEECRDQIEGGIVGDIERLRARRRRADLRVPDAPRCRMPRHVKLHHHPHTTETGVFHNGCNVVLCVFFHFRVRAVPQLGMGLGFHGKRL